MWCKHFQTYRLCLMIRDNVIMMKDTLIKHMSSSPVVACDKKSKITKQGEESKNRVLDPKFDSTFKKLLGSEDNKNITKQFIRDITGLSVVDVNFLNPYVDRVFQAKSIIGVVCRSSSGERFLIEIQKSYQRGFSRRMLYYGAKIFSSQLAVGNNDYFGALRNVVVIAVSNGPLRMDNPSHITHHRLLDIETCKCEMEGLEFYFVDLTKFGIKANEMKLVTNPIDRWCYYFKYIHEISSTELDAFLERYPEMRNAVKELSRFNLSEKEYESYLLWKMGLSGDPSSEAELAEDMTNDRIKQIAKKMLARGDPIEEICIITGLKKEDFVE